MSIEQYLKRAFDLYMEELKKNKYVLNFLKENTSLSVEDLKKKKIDILMSVYKHQESFDSLRDLGIFHYRLGLSHTEFLDAFDRIECYLNRILLHENKLDYKSYTKIVEFFKKVKDYVALGYLNGYIKHDLQILKLLYEKEEDALITKNFIKSHILWLIAILKSLEKLQKEEGLILEHKKCSFSWFLKESNINNLLEAHEKELIEYLHKIVHANAEDIFFQLENKEYAKLLNSYVSLIRNSLALLNLLAVIVIQENILEIKIDPLTGLLNRRAMDEILEHNLRISIIAEEPFTIAMADIDNFKKINDEYGHLVGDCVLKNIAKIIKEHLRKSDFVFRYGGEEFLILLPSTKKEDAYHVLERIRKIIEESTIKCEKYDINITISIGLESTIPNKNTDMSIIIENADIKLYQAKKSGKNKIVY